MRIGLLFAPIALMALDVGWNLVGAKRPVDAALLQRDYISVVWHYKDGVWRYFANVEVDFPKIEQIEAGEGFWVLSTQQRPDAFWLERGTSWYWQLQGDLNMSVDAKVYDIDLFDTPKEVIEELHRQGRVVICYFSAGSYEEWREDAALFETEDLGKALDGWPGERWLDIRSQNVRTIMRRRLDLAKAKGCDGVEPDNVDGFTNDTGFDLSAGDQLEYNLFLAQEAHKRGLLVGLKNDVGQIEALEPYFDFAVNEECFAYEECEAYLPFLQKNKAVFNAEYSDAPDCQKARLYGISAAKFSIALDGGLFEPCF